MNPYTWIVWKDCRLAGYVVAYSEYEALIKAKDKYGDRLFVERIPLGELVTESRVKYGC